MARKGPEIWALLFGRRNGKSRRSSLLRWTRRAILLPAVLLLIAYATVPWWLPVNWLHGQIVSQLQRDLRRPVSLAGIDVSWWDGIVLRDLRVRRAEQFGPGDLLRVERIVCPLTPLRTLFQRRIERLQIVNCQLDVVRNEAGLLNIADLLSAAELKLPSRSIDIDRIVCDGARVVLVNRKRRQTSVIQLGTLDFRMDSATGTMRAAVSGRGGLRTVEGGPAEAGQRDLGHFSISANVLDPFARPDARTGQTAPQQGGQLQLSYRAVDLASLTLNDLAAAQRLGLLKLAGQCGGKLDLQLDAEGRLDWQFTTSFQGLDLELAAAPRGVHMPTGRLELAGRYDIPSRHNTIERLSLKLPGVELSARVELRVDGNYLGLQIDRARLRPASVRRVAPDLLAWMDPTWQVAGEVTLSGLVELADSFNHVNLTLDATALEARAPGLLDKPAGLAATVTLHARHEQDVDRLTVEGLALKLGASEVTVKAAAGQLYPIYTGRKKIWDVWLDWMGELDVRTPDAQELLARLPALRRAIGRTQIAGPVHATLKFQPIVEQVDVGRPPRVLARRLTAKLGLGRGSRFVLPAPAVAPTQISNSTPAPPGRNLAGAPDAVLLDKRGDEPMVLALDTRFAPDSLTVEAGSVTLRRGDDPSDDAVLAMSPFSGKLAFSYPAAGPDDRPGKPEMDLVLDGELAGQRVQRLIELSPLLRQWLADRQVELAGGFDGQVNVRLRPEHMRARLALRLRDLDTRIANAALLEALGTPPGEGETPPALLVKQAGKPASVEVNYTSFPTEAGRRHDNGRIDWQGLGLTVHVEASRLTDVAADRPAEQHRVEFRIDDAATLLAHSPALAQRVKRARWELSGSASGSASWRPGIDHVIGIELDASGLEARWSGRKDWLGRKPAGMPLTLRAQVVTDLPNAPARPRINVQQGRLAIGRCDLNVSGSIVLLPVWWGDSKQKSATAERRDRGPQSGGHLLGSFLGLDRPLPVDRLDLAVSGRLAADDSLNVLLPALARRLADWGIHGEARLLARLTGGWQQWQLQAELDGQRLAVNVPARLVKPSGVPARVQFDVVVSPRLELWDVREFSGELADVQLAGRGQVRRRIGGLTPANYDLTVGIKVPDLDRLGKLCPLILSRPQLLSGPLAGRIETKLHLFSDEPAAGASPPAEAGTALRLLPSSLSLTDVQCMLAGTPLSASGQVEFSQRSLFIPKLTLQMKDSRLAVVARIHDPAGQPTGWIDLAGETLDIDQLKAFWGRLRGSPASRQGPARAAAPDSEPARPAEAGSDTPAAVPAPAGAEPAGQPAREIIDFLARCDVSGRVHLADLHVTDPKNQTRYKLSEFTSDFTLDGGKVDVPFRTAMEGGVLTGKVDCDLADEAPMLGVSYEAYKLFPTENVQPLVEAFFPGMSVSGYVTMAEKNRQKLLPEPGEANWSVGSGEIIFEDGLLVGQAGPDWMVKVFPGLKLTQYRFERMHNWFTLTADGRANHHMIFEGQSYDIYMIGHTHRGTRQAKYTVGVDLLASLDSKTWSVDLRQGKIPLMYVSGRIENRQLKDADFRMVPPPIALWQMLLRDNILYRGVIERALKRGK